MKLTIWLLGMIFFSFSGDVFSMGAISTHASIIDGKYVEVHVSADCKGCWFNEEASISGSIILKGQSQRKVTVSDSVRIYKGQYNNTSAYVYTIDSPAEYVSAVLDLTVSGPGTRSKYIRDTLSVRDSYLAYQKKQNAIEEKEIRFNRLLASQSPQEMYVEAGNFVLNNDEGRAVKLYKAIIQKFSGTQWAVKSSDKLLSIKFKGDLINKSEEYEVNRRYERLQDSKKCSERKQSCRMSCNGDYGCYSYCDSICTE